MARRKNPKPDDKSQPWVEDQTLQESFLRAPSLDEIRKHLERGGSPNIHFGPTSLLYHAADTGNVEAIKLLLDHGADPNGIPMQDAVIPAIRQAAMRGHADIIRLLLAAGADVNVRDMQGDTAILHARKGDNLEAAQLLIEAGADPTLENAGGQNALNYKPRSVSADRVGDYLRNLKFPASLPKSAAGPSTPRRGRGKKEEPADPFQQIREMQTNGINYDVTPDDVVARLSLWNKLYGITISDVSHDSVRVTFHRLPDPVEPLALEIEKFCPDVIAQGYGCYAEMYDHLQETDHELPRDIAELIEGVDLDDENYGRTLLVKALKRDRTVHLWWD